jgi:hypothetical protein
LLLVSALLFPLDVASRRLRLEADALRRLGEQLQKRLAPAPAGSLVVEPVVLKSLFSARERIGRPAMRSEQAASRPRPAHAPVEAEVRQAVPVAEEADTFARLRAARERAGRR